ncbi:MAG TPA: hypothetical protein VGF79_02335 [Bacteroidia bacterium]
MNLQKSHKWLQVLATYPFILLLFLMFPLIDQTFNANEPSYNYFSIDFNLNNIEKVFEFLTQTMMTMWLFTFPVWLICLLFIMTEAKKLKVNEIKYIVLGFFGQLILFCISYYQYIHWS